MASNLIHCLYLTISFFHPRWHLGFNDILCQNKETEEAYETVWTQQISACLCFHNWECTLSHILAKYFFYVCFASVLASWGLSSSFAQSLALFFTRFGFKVWDSFCGYSIKENKGFIWLMMNYSVLFIHSVIIQHSVCYSYTVNYFDLCE